MPKEETPPRQKYPRLQFAPGCLRTAYLWASSCSQVQETPAVVELSCHNGSTWPAASKKASDQGFMLQTHTPKPLQRPLSAAARGGSQGPEGTRPTNGLLPMCAAGQESQRNSTSHAAPSAGPGEPPQLHAPSAQHASAEHARLVQTGQGGAVQRSKAWERLNLQR